MQTPEESLRIQRNLCLSKARTQALDELKLSFDSVQKELKKREGKINLRTNEPYEEFFVTLRRLRYLVECQKVIEKSNGKKQKMPSQVSLSLQDKMEVDGFTFSRGQFYQQHNFQRDLDKYYFELLFTNSSFCRVRVNRTHRKNIPFLAISFPYTTVSSVSDN